MARKARTRPALDHPDEGRPWLEYGFATLGAVFALGVVLVIGWHWLTSSSTPPDIIVQTIGTAASSGGNTVTFRVTNRGGQTASEVTVEGRSADETSILVFDFVPGGSERNGAMIFRADPAQLRWRVVSYREP